MVAQRGEGARAAGDPRERWGKSLRAGKRRVVCPWRAGGKPLLLPQGLRMKRRKIQSPALKAYVALLHTSLAIERNGPAKGTRHWQQWEEAMRGPLGPSKMAMAKQSKKARREKKAKRSGRGQRRQSHNDDTQAQGSGASLEGGPSTPSPTADRITRSRASSDAGTWQPGGSSPAPQDFLVESGDGASWGTRQKRSRPVLGFQLQMDFQLPRDDEVFAAGLGCCDPDQSRCCAPVSAGAHMPEPELTNHVLRTNTAGAGEAPAHAEAAEADAPCMGARRSPEANAMLQARSDQRRAPPLTEKKRRGATTRQPGRASEAAGACTGPSSPALPRRGGHTEASATRASNVPKGGQTALAPDMGCSLAGGPGAFLPPELFSEREQSLWCPEVLPALEPGSRPPTSTEPSPPCATEPSPPTSRKISSPEPSGLERSGGGEGSKDTGPTLEGSQELGTKAPPCTEGSEAVPGCAIRTGASVPGSKAPTIAAKDEALPAPGPEAATRQAKRKRVKESGKKVNPQGVAALPAAKEPRRQYPLRQRKPPPAPITPSPPPRTQPSKPALLVQDSLAEWAPVDVVLDEFCPSEPLPCLPQVYRRQRRASKGAEGGKGTQIGPLGFVGDSGAQAALLRRACDAVETAHGVKRRFLVDAAGMCGDIEVCLALPAPRQAGRPKAPSVASPAKAAQPRAARPGSSRAGSAPAVAAQHQAGIPPAPQAPKAALAPAPVGPTWPPVPGREAPSPGGSRETSGVVSTVPLVLALAAPKASTAAKRRPAALSMAAQPPLALVHQGTPAVPQAKPSLALVVRQLAVVGPDGMTHCAADDLSVVSILSLEVNALLSARHSVGGCGGGVGDLLPFPAHPADWDLQEQRARKAAALVESEFIEPSLGASLLPPLLQYQRRREAKKQVARRLSYESGQIKGGTSAAPATEQRTGALQTTSGERPAAVPTKKRQRRKRPRSSLAIPSDASTHPASANATSATLPAQPGPAAVRAQAAGLAQASKGAADPESLPLAACRREAPVAGILGGGGEQPDYIHLSQNIYLIRPALESLEENFCECSLRGDGCGEQCLCRVQSMSCWEDCACAKAPGGCRNRPFDRPKQLSIRKTAKCGWGAYAVEGIPKGGFIVEYAGEVIDDEMCERRLWELRAKGRNDWYMCEVNKDYVIDATRKGGYGRFLNHSCEPNAFLEKWRVGNVMRIGIFARRSIRAGEEITYDYNFITFGEEKECHCGAPTCRGTINKNKGGTEGRGGSKKQKRKPKASPEAPAILESDGSSPSNASTVTEASPEVHEGGAKGGPNPLCQPPLEPCKDHQQQAKPPRSRSSLGGDAGKRQPRKDRDRKGRGSRAGGRVPHKRGAEGHSQTQMAKKGAVQADKPGTDPGTDSSTALALPVKAAAADAGVPRGASQLAGAAVSSPPSLTLLKLARRQRSLLPPISAGPAQAAPQRKRHTGRAPVLGPSTSAAPVCAPEDARRPPPGATPPQTSLCGATQPQTSLCGATPPRAAPAGLPSRPKTGLRRSTRLKLGPPDKAHSSRGTCEASSQATSQTNWQAGGQSARVAGPGGSAPVAPPHSVISTEYRGIMTKAMRAHGFGSARGGALYSTPVQHGTLNPPQYPVGFPHLLLRMPVLGPAGARSAMGQSPVSSHPSSLSSQAPGLTGNCQPGPSSPGVARVLQTVPLQEERQLAAPRGQILNCTQIPVHSAPVLAPVTQVLSPGALSVDGMAGTSQVLLNQGPKAQAAPIEAIGVEGPFAYGQSDLGSSCFEELKQGFTCARTRGSVPHAPRARGQNGCKHQELPNAPLVRILVLGEQRHETA